MPNYFKKFKELFQMHPENSEKPTTEGGYSPEEIIADSFGAPRKQKFKKLNQEIVEKPEEADPQDYQTSNSETRKKLSEYMRGKR